MLALSLTLGLLQGSHLPWHPAQPRVLVEVPDVAGLLAAYERAPFLALTRDEAARAAIARFSEQMQFDMARGLAPLMATLGLPETTGTAELLEIAKRATRVSISVSTHEERPEELREAFERVVRTQLEVLDIEDAITSQFDSAQPSGLEQLALPEALRTDEWGRPYVLETEEDGRPRVVSLGSDGAPGGAGAEADIDSGLDQARWLEREIERRRAVLVVIDFASLELARASLDALLEGMDADADEATRALTIGGQPGEHRTFVARRPSEQAGWCWISGQRLLFELGPAPVEALDARLANAASSFAGDERWMALEASDRSSGANLGGAIVAQGAIDTEWIAGELAGLVDFLGDAQALPSFQPSTTAFRMTLNGERFTTDLWRPEPSDAAWFGALGAARPGAAVLQAVPADATGAMATQLDVARLERQFRARVGLDEAAAGALAELERQHGFSLEKDVFGSLGGGMTLHVMPLNSIGLPNAVATLELRDSGAFVRGMNGLAAAFAQQATQGLKLKATRYRDAPLWTIEMERGAESPLPFEISPTLAVVGNRLVVTTTALFAKREVKRLLGEEVAGTHAIASLEGVPADATMVGAMDWRAMVDSLYTTLRGAAALAGSFADLPIDLTALAAALPEKPEIFTRFFRPTQLWGRPVERGYHLHMQASFGPETWASLAALGVGVVQSMSAQERATPAEPAPSEPAPSDPGLELTRQALDRVGTRLFVYSLDQGSYPDALIALTKPSSSYPQGYLDGQPLPNDGWGRELRYERAADGATYRLWSLGPDGNDGTSDDIVP